MAVHPNCRRIGVGKELLNKVLKKESPKRSYIEFVLRESNLDAQLFLKAQNFKATRVVRNKYRDTSEDGYIMKHSFQKTLVYEGAF